MKIQNKSEVLSSDPKVSILLDSLLEGIRVTTFELYYPRIIHAEIMTHRVFSRNASSSRAIPVGRMILEHANYVPANWRKNQKGMQPAGIFSSTDEVSQVSYEIWLDARDNAIFSARELMELGVAKEQVNRLLEPFSFIKVIVTSTDYENFFRLRSHKDAQWEIRQLSDMMKEAYHNSTPAERNFHLPYVNMDEYEDSKNFIDAIKQSVARCARVSYATHDGKEPTLESDLELYSRLVEQYPPHASPAEHQIMSLKFYSENAEKFGWPKIGEVAPHALHGNMQYGVVQYRKVLEALSGSSVR